MTWPISDTTQGHSLILLTNHVYCCRLHTWHYAGAFIIFINQSLITVLDCNICTAVSLNINNERVNYNLRCPEPAGGRREIKMAIVLEWQLSWGQLSMANSPGGPRTLQEYTVFIIIQQPHNNVIYWLSKGNNIYRYIVMRKQQICKEYLNLKQLKEPICSIQDLNSVIYLYFIRYFSKCTMNNKKCIQMKSCRMHSVQIVAEIVMLAIGGHWYRI